ncbi:MAG: hypothetical protein FWH47_04725 [Methanomassiliicoccaceae archaeon]|nr:hypothetical protein [Methanomassiliicoccaceae archaeon]
MAMIDIEYRHSSEPPEDDNLRRQSVEEMSDYLKGLVDEMLRSDISAKLTVSEGEGPNMVFVNGKSITDILAGLDIKMLDSDDACDHGKVSIVSFGRPILEWNRGVIEDIPDVLVKNAVSKAYADVLGDRTL